MIAISEIQTTAPTCFRSNLQESVYAMLEELRIPFERVDTDEIITMEDCAEVNKTLQMEMVKTLFLCNRQQTEFYLFVTKGDKPFRATDFSRALQIARVSFAPAALLKSMLQTDIGAATVLSCIADPDCAVTVVLDKAVADAKSDGCSDGVNTGYLKLKTDDVCHKILPYLKHEAVVIEV